VVRGRAAALVAVFYLPAAMALAAGTDGQRPTAAEPVAVENERPESELALVKLVPQAAARLGIRTVAIRREPVVRRRSVGGVVMTPAGRIIQVSAPTEGNVLGVDGNAFPFPGTKVRAGAELLRLLVVSAPELARAREVIEVAMARVAVAEAAQSTDATPESELELAEARRSLAAARRRQQVLTGTGDAADLAPVSVSAPISGVIRSLMVSPGQSVPAGAPLVEIVATDPMWVRTPVFAGDVRSFASDRGASVRRLGDREVRPASPVAAPPSADPALASIDLYYSVPNPDGDLRDGERVEVNLAMKGKDRALVLPYAAVVYDTHGGTWVYEEVDAHVFTRRRIDIAFVDGDQVIATRGPADGARIVVEGVSELFGAEFGIGR